MIYSENHSAAVVTVDIWYNTGSRNERPGRSGVAHLFEHMMFQGSAHVKKAEHFQLVRAAGGQLNGSTQEDRTNYWEELPSNRLNLGLWLEADRMRSLAITDSTFHNQREAVKEERRLGVDNQPYGRAFTDGLVAPFDSTSCFAYAHTVIGSMTDLDSAKTADVQAFFDTYYAPNNATLVVTGDLQPGELHGRNDHHCGEQRCIKSRKVKLCPRDQKKIGFACHCHARDCPRVLGQKNVSEWGWTYSLKSDIVAPNQNSGCIHD